MDKEKILERSRSSMAKEERSFAETEGIKIGFIVFTVLYLVLVIYNYSIARRTDVYEISALFWTFMASINYQKYKSLDKKRKLYLVTFIISTLAAIVYFLDYIFITRNISFLIFG